MFPLSDSVPARRFPFFNLLLIAGTVIVFLQQLIAPNQEAFTQTYALIPALVHFETYETLIPFVTAMFLHGGFLHIISNMWFLWVFGDNIEGYVGFVPFLFLYFLSGIVGNLTQYLVMPDSAIPMLGASGAVAGVLGAYYVLFSHSKIKTLVPFFGFLSVVEIPAPFMLGYWFVLQILSGAATLPFAGSETGGIAFFAHIGGFVTGVVFAKLFRPKKRYS